MRRGSWNYDVRARWSLADAVSLVSDIRRQGALHPLIIRIQELPPPEGVVRSFLITDRLAGGFRIRNRADTLRVTDQEVVSIAHQRPRTRLRNHARFTVEGDVVHIAVTVTLDAPTLLFAIAFRQGRKAHLTLAERLQEALDSP